MNSKQFFLLMASLASPWGEISLLYSFSTAVFMVRGKKSSQRGKNMPLNMIFLCSTVERLLFKDLFEQAPYIMHTYNHHLRSFISLSMPDIKYALIFQYRYSCQEGLWVVVWRAKIQKAAG
jgi:hypothetical protein